MNFKKALLVICLIICLLSMASASASDVNDTVMASDNDLIENDELSSSESSILEAIPDGTFTDLANKIAHAQGELNLTGDYYYDFNWDDDYYYYGITIDKSIVINGNGFIIETGDEYGKIFNITASNVVLKNICFQNFDDEQTALDWSGGNGTLYNCVFKNGGSVDWSGPNGNLYNCSFIKSKSQLGWSGPNGNLYNCSFMNSGPVYWASANGNLFDCIFLNTYSYGDGAVYWLGTDGNLYNCSFMNCSSEIDGAGAVLWSGANGNLFDCSFVKSTASNWGDGGAVLWNGANGNLSSCTFVNSSIIDEGDGGAVYWHGANGTLYNCSFVNSSVIGEGDGGAVYWHGANGVLYDCSFVNSSTSEGLGDTIYWSGAEGTMYDCIFNGIYEDYEDYCYFSEKLKPMFAIEAGNVEDGKRITVRTQKLTNNVTAHIYNVDNQSLFNEQFSFSSRDNLTHEFILNNLSYGEYLIVLSYPGDNLYLNGSYNKTFCISDNILIDASSIIVNHNDDSELVATLFEEGTGKFVIGENVIVNVDNVNYTLITNSEGQIKFPTNNLASGNHTAVIIVNGKYNSSRATVYVFVKYDAILTANNIITPYGVSSMLKVTLKDTEGNGIAGLPVNIVLDTISQTLITDSEGKVSLSTIGLAIGLYTALIRFDGNDMYSPSNTTANVNIISHKTGTFTDLANEIAIAEGEYNLTRNYVYGSEDYGYEKGIVIDKSIVINGNGFTIDGKEQARVFKISSSNVTLNNICFKNLWYSNDFDTPEGGAIYWSGSYGVLSNCSFENCFNFYAYDCYGRGGAVYWNGDNGVIANCSFVECFVDTDNEYIFDLDYCLGFDGGAVYWKGANGTLFNCTFVECSARTGGAVYWKGANGTLFNSSFMECLVDLNNPYKESLYNYYEDVRFYGGSVYWEGINGNLYNCSFMNTQNHAQSERGGAIYWNGANGNLYNCSFMNTCSIYGGGAIDWNGANGNLYNCSFMNTRSYGSSGGAIDWKGINGTLYDCSFIKCDAYYGGGAVYWVHANGTLYDCSFIKCDAFYGGAVYWGHANGTLYDCSFMNCSVYTIYDEGRIGDSTGGAVCWDGEDGTLYDCSFMNTHSDDYGGAVYWEGANGILLNSTFINSDADVGGAVYWSKWYGKASNASVIGCNFKNCTADFAGGIYYSAENCSLINSFFDGNYANQYPDWYSIEDLNISGTTTTKVSTILTVTGLNTTYHSSEKLIITLKDINNNTLAGGKIIMILNKLRYSETTNSEGQAEFSTSMLSINEYPVTFSFVGNRDYSPSSLNTNIVVNKISPVLTIDDVVIVANTTEDIVATLTDENGDAVCGIKVKVVVGNLTKIAKTNESGQISMDISGLAPGEYKISARSGITDIYNEAKASAKATIYAEKLNATLTIPNVVGVYNKTGVVVATLTDDKGDVLSGIKVKIVVGSLTKIAKTDENGQISMDISSLEAGEYTISARSAVTDIYNEAKANANAIIYADKFDTTLNIPDVVAIYNAAGTSVVATLTDENGDAVSGIKVKIVVGGLSKIAKTDENGQISLDISSLEAGEYTISARSAVTDIYNEAKTSAKAIIYPEKLNATLTIPDVVGVYNAVGTSVVATLTDENGDAVSGIKVKIVVGGLSKIAKTDANGQVSMDISSLEIGEYKISARSAITDIHNEAKTNAKATIVDKLNATLTIPDAVAVYNVEGVAVATLKDASGNIISGVKVKIVVGSLSKIAKTDANGQISMNISSLAPGEYKISARSAVTDIYNEAKATASAIISEDKLDTTLTIPDIDVVYGDAGAIAVATLKDEFGNIISGVKVKLVVGNMSKIAKTDANGQVSMDISSLAPGEYKISARSAVTGIYNEAKAYATATINKINPTLTIHNVEISQGIPGAVAVATLKDANGKVVSGVKVKLVVGDLSKIAKTDDKGKISIDISGLAPGEYKISGRSAVTDIYNEAKASANAIIYED